MFNTAFFVRCLIVVVVAILLFALIPPVLRAIGFPVSADLILIIRIVIAACALFYVFKGGSDIKV